VKTLFNVVNVIFKLKSHKGKPKKFLEIMPIENFQKYMLFEQKNKKINKNCNSYGLMKILSNFNYLKVFNYQMVKVFK
jgi:hypothetical protein